MIKQRGGGEGSSCRPLIMLVVALIGLISLIGRIVVVGSGMSNGGIIARDRRRGWCITHKWRLRGCRAVLAVPSAWVGAAVLRRWTARCRPVRVQKVLRAHPTGAFAHVLMRRNMGKLRKGNVRWRPLWAGAGRRAGPNSDAPVSRAEISPGTSSITGIAPSLQQDAALLAAVRRRGREAAGHGSKTPFLDVSLNEYKTHLSKVHMHRAWAVRSNRWEEIRRL